MLNFLNLTYGMNIWYELYEFMRTSTDDRYFCERSVRMSTTCPTSARRVELTYTCNNISTLEVSGINCGATGSDSAPGAVLHQDTLTHQAPVQRHMSSRVVPGAALHQDTLTHRAPVQRHTSARVVPWAALHQDSLTHRAPVLRHTSGRVVPGAALHQDTLTDWALVQRHTPGRVVPGAALH